MTKKQIIKWLDKHDVKNYTINNDLTVDVDGDVNLRSKNLLEIPVQFNKVNGYFYCSYNELTSLKGCPKVTKDFFCAGNKLTSLKYCPEIVNGYFDCARNELTSLKYCPTKVKGYFACNFNKITSLYYAPKEINEFFSCRGNKLTSLKYCPQLKHAKHELDILENPFTSFTDWPKSTRIWCKLQNLLTVTQLKELVAKEPEWLDVICKIKCYY